MQMEQVRTQSCRIEPAYGGKREDKDDGVVVTRYSVLKSRARQAKGQRHQSR